MVKDLSNHCACTQQVDELKVFLKNEDYDTDSVKNDTQNMKKSNLSHILSGSEALNCLIDFLEAESGLIVTFHVSSDFSSCLFYDSSRDHFRSWLYILLLGLLQENAYI